MIPPLGAALGFSPGGPVTATPRGVRGHPLKMITWRALKGAADANPDARIGGSESSKPAFAGRG